MKSYFKELGLGIALAATGCVWAGCASTATSTSTGQYIDDSAITAKVKAGLARDDLVNGFAVKVETFRGVVQLSGFVDTEEEKRQAGVVARGVADVIEVTNNLIVKPSAQK